MVLARMYDQRGEWTWGRVPLAEDGQLPAIVTTGVSYPSYSYHLRALPQRIGWRHRLRLLLRYRRWCSSLPPAYQETAGIDVVCVVCWSVVGFATHHVQADSLSCAHRDEYSQDHITPLVPREVADEVLLNMPDIAAVTVGELRALCGAPSVTSKELRARLGD